MNVWCRNIQKTNLSFYKKYVFELNEKENKHFPNDIQIESINNFNDFKKFYKLPFILYKNDKNWVPPFWYDIKNFFKKNNIFWSHAECKLFIAKKKNEIVGRIAAIIDYKFCESVGKKIGFFGFFECIQDFECANALLQTAEQWLLSKKMHLMQGPINGRVDVGCGFLYYGFNLAQSLLSNYSPTYYVSFVEKYGMKKSRDQIIYYVDLKKPIPNKLVEKSKICSKNGLKLRPFNRLRTNKEMKWWVDLFLETFSDHWGYVPVSKEEVRNRFGVKQIRWFVDSKLFLVAEFNNFPVAFIWATPEYNQIFQKTNGKLGLFQILLLLFFKRQINKGKLHFIGIKKEFRKQNIASFLNYKILVEMKKRGYIGAEIGWVDEENIAAHKTIELTGAKIYKKFRVFEKSLPSN